MMKESLPYANLAGVVLPPKRGPVQIAGTLSTRRLKYPIDIVGN